MSAIQTSTAYAVLRHGGASARRVEIELALQAPAASRLEAAFLRRRGGLRPRFADDEAHVRAVLAEGGFPTLKAQAR